MALSFEERRLLKRLVSDELRRRATDGAPRQDPMTGATIALYCSHEGCEWKRDPVVDPELAAIALTDHLRSHEKSPRHPTPA